MLPPSGSLWSGRGVVANDPATSKVSGVEEEVLLMIPLAAGSPGWRGGAPKEVV